MNLLFFILIGACLQAAAATIVRWIQAKSSDKYASVVANYTIALLIAGVYWLLSTPADDTWCWAVLIGVCGGLFYTAAVLTIIRSMGQRGLSMTTAIASTSQCLPCLIAIFMGESMLWYNGLGIAVVAVAVPLMSLATASGTAIHQAPSFRLAAGLFLLQGGAMSANLLAAKWVHPVAFPVYLVSLFASGFLFSLVAWRLRASSSAQCGGDWLRGLIFGSISIGTTLFVVIAASRVGGALFFAGMSVSALLLTTIIAVIWWHERLHKLGWIGLGLTAVAMILLNT
jgi:drug/metabolite transporter (DMT)-like permease